MRVVDYLTCPLLSCLWVISRLFSRLHGVLVGFSTWLLLIGRVTALRDVMVLFPPGQLLGNLMKGETHPLICGVRILYSLIFLLVVGC